MLMVCWGCGRRCRRVIGPAVIARRLEQGRSGPGDSTSTIKLPSLRSLALRCRQMIERALPRCCSPPSRRRRSQTSRQRGTKRSVNASQLLTEVKWRQLMLNGGCPGRHHCPVIRVRFLPAAEAELLHETDDYSKARKGFGVRFKDVVKTASDHAARTPEAGAPGFRGTRKFRVTGVPFNLHYRHSENEVPEDHELARLFRPPPAWANPQAPDLWRHLVQQLAAVLDARAILEGNPQATLERFRRQPGGMRHDDHVA